MPERTTEGDAEHIPEYKVGDQPLYHRHHFFYLSGRSVVFKVHDTLFKVDAALFGDEDSTFKTMLELPQGGATHEGTDDCNAIVLHDTPAEFESLVWGLNVYRFSEANVSPKDITRFVQLVEMSHKYDLRTLEAWATSGLHRLAQNDVSVRRSHAAQLLDAFSLCDCAEDTSLMLSTVRSMLHEKACSLAEKMGFIDVCQRFSLQGTLALAYYSILLRPRSEWGTDPSVTRAHHIRLLSGYYALSEYSLEADIQSLKESFDGIHEAWGAAWSRFATQSKERELRVAQGLKVVDVGARLRHIVEAFLNEHLSSTNTDCDKLIFREKVEARIDYLMEHEFAHYFSDISNDP